MTTVELTQKFEGHQGPVTTLRFSKDYRYIISSSQDSTIRIWSLEKGKEINCFQGHLDSVNSFAINSTDSQMFSGSSDNSVCWWDVQRGEMVQKIRGHSESVNSVCYNLDSSVVVSGSLDTTAKIWDCRSNTSRPVQVLSDSTDSITCVSCSRYEIFTASIDGRLRIYDIRNCCLTTDHICNSIVHMELTSEHQAMLITTLESQILFVTKQQGQVLSSYGGHLCSSYYIKSHFASHEALVVSGSETGEVFAWELTEGTVQQRFSFGEGPILDVAVQEPLNCIVAGSSNGDIGVFRKAKTN
ncbi:WD40 repeat-like protein [Histomonas meleagridis]|uniref:WD40 repeat-like protein n=1 Tax=Histomonas meleagridis TaxID=135588 RepID=UPI00355A1DDD|nr:WD40 repeat-like protein [Histomonas meleagridis]KAH0798963.1 WD40 repeat-like protein [Histomonas meleagridis]